MHAGSSVHLPRLVLIPGLGIGPELFDPQRTLPARVQILDWPRTREGESMRTYARRLVDEGAIAPSDDLFVGGMSFGAMLALEVAAALRPRPRGVFLIAGARSGNALWPPVRWLCRFTRRMPQTNVKPTTNLIAPLLVRMVGRPDRGQRATLLRWAGDAIPWLTQWGCFAMDGWHAPANVGCPVHHIHGQLDRMIPISRLHPPPDRVVQGGGHVIHLTHAEQVNAFISQRLSV